MNRVAVLVASLLLCEVARAQSIKGTVVDDATKAPVSGVYITIIDANGADVGRGVRSDSAGGFIVHAARAGTWRVKTMRIGYAPLTSPPVDLAIGALAVLRLSLTTVAQQLAPVQVVERRQYSASELMSTTGYDLRQERGQGQFLSGERLHAMGRDGAREVLATYFQPHLFVYTDPVLGEVLRMREHGKLCAPEVFLDGRLLSTVPEPKPLQSAEVPQTYFDSMRAQMRQDSDSARRAFAQISALNILSGYTAQALHGIEVYRANEVPPASLGAWFGMTKSSIEGCGTISVWTKAGAISVEQVKGNRITSKPVQVITGTLVDFETDRPVANRQVTLLTGDLDIIGIPVTTDDFGEFSLRTTRTGELRIRAGDTTYLPSTSPPVTLSSNELVVVKFYVSMREPVRTPLGVAGRLLPQNISSTSRAGFTYRRERGQGGRYFRAADLARMSAQSITRVLAALPDVELTEASTAADSITVRQAGARSGCKPAFYLDGIPAVSSAAAMVPIDRILGIEIYTRPMEVPYIFIESRECGVIAIWTKPGARG